MADQIEDQEEETQLEKELPTSDKDCLSCSSCGNVNPKYRCPRCNVKSCSLNCVKSHKQRNHCTGQRNKTKFVMKTEFNENNLLNDYRFLEEANRVADNAIRDRKNKLMSLSGNVKRVQKNAAQRGIHLKLMPVGFKKRRENTTYFHRRFKMIRWRIKWLFPQASAEYVENRVPGEEKMCALINKYIDPTHADPVYKQKLKEYHAVDVGEICIFLKDCSARQTSFFKIDMSKTLEDALKGKVVIEYPTFHVVLPRHVTEFPVLNPGSKRLHEDSSTTDNNTLMGTHPDFQDMPMGSNSLENRETEPKTKEARIEICTNGGSSSETVLTIGSKNEKTVELLGK